ncbi:hypothetical protein KCM76_17800 [Zooshikella marina]|uniref:hypothetical protein n=1 Tax=Zooshikella ganghwensis TaxID=202772 RepID=UPI001BB04E02|nr:hypothetical protein [Zooshikella ganghwensis]MBU2707853.1 hypothetical protein [Zooshikella ganghwensis]
MRKSTLQWKTYSFEASPSNEGNKNWLDLVITNSDTSWSVFSRVSHVVDAKVWKRELIKFKDGEGDIAEVFKLGSDFSIRLLRKEGIIYCSVNLNPDPLLENYSETIEFKADDIDSLIDFIENFIREYETLVG